jgi:hypothetical protein
VIIVQYTNVSIFVSRTQHTAHNLKLQSAKIKTAQYCYLGDCRVYLDNCGTSLRETSSATILILGSVCTAFPKASMVENKSLHCSVGVYIGDYVEETYHRRKMKRSGPKERSSA